MSVNGLSGGYRVEEKGDGLGGHRGVSSAALRDEERASFGSALGTDEALAGASPGAGLLGARARAFGETE